jgi:flavin reductase (DIM6/NTAB) family NADH-FMN oxidoreductase RutF
MFFEPRKRDHGLPHDPFKALVAPRPIGWISAMDANGALNLSPYSFFNAFGSRPPIVGFSSEGQKDAASFVEETGEFVCNLATLKLAQAMNATSAPLPRGQSEFAYAGLETEPSRLVKPPRIKGIAAALECRLTEIHRLKDVNGDETGSIMVFGEVVGIYIDPQFIRDGIVDTAAMQPLARCGYQDYAVVEKVFSLRRPGA